MYKYFQNTHQNQKTTGFGVYFFQEYLWCSEKKAELHFKPVKGSKSFEILST